MNGIGRSDRISFSPGFSPVYKGDIFLNRFNGLDLLAYETVETVHRVTLP
jgi:hypothetical protein